MKYRKERGFFVLCKICNQKQANSRHIKTHGLTYDEYLQQYEKDMYWQKKAVEKLNELYVTVRYQFVEYGSTYTATIKRNERGFGLTDKDLKGHLEGKKTIAVYTPTEKTKFLSFDVDTTDLAVLERLIETLSNYIPKQDIHCSFSGSKGYHVDLFFSSLIDKSIAYKFYQLVLMESGLNPKQVECRGPVNTALKIPLGFHVKTGAYCYPCNEFGVEIQDDTNGYKTFCDIEPFDPKVIYEAVEVNYSNSYFTDEETIQLEELKADVNLLPIYEGNIEYKRESIEELIKNGIYQQGERHQATYKIAIYLKEEGYSKEDARKFLEQWTKYKCNPALYSSSEREVKQDIKDTVNSVYRNDYRLRSDAKQVQLNKMEIKEILSVKNQTLQRLYFIMYTHCKAFGDSQGVFYMTYKQLEEAGATKDNRNYLKQKIDELADLGKVAVIRRNARVDNQLKNMPNKYQIVALQEELSVTIGKTFTPCEQQTKECLDCTACHLLSSKEIKECYGRRSKDMLKLKERLRKTPLLCSTKIH